jgi:hypothetical protein
MTDTVCGIRRLLNRARQLVALATLVGVLAMHWFSTDNALAGPTMTASADSVQASGARVAHSGMAHSCMTREHDAARAVAGESSCPMSHSECLATLRSAAYGKHPVGFGLPVPAAPAHSHLTTAPTLVLSAGHSPPDVSLTRLCISRT